jgi:hypothetical protein
MGKAAPVASRVVPEAAFLHEVLIVALEPQRRLTRSRSALLAMFGGNVESQDPIGSLSLAGHSSGGHLCGRGIGGMWTRGAGRSGTAAKHEANIAVVLC